jgi:hypothetical protein
VPDATLSVPDATLSVPDTTLSVPDEDRLVDNSKKRPASHPGDSP